MGTPVDFLKQRDPDRSVADMLADIFRKRILEGEYLPGMRLVETDVTELYGVSRGPVREAFRRLIAEGLLLAEKHKSPVVRGVGKKQFYQMFEVRSVLEGLAARLAATSMSIARKREWIAKEIDIWSSDRAWTEHDFVSANSTLHEGIRDIIEHEVLNDQIQRIAIPGFKAVFLPAITNADIKASAAQHVDILKAIYDGDGKLAERHMVDHVMDTAERVTVHFNDELFDRRLRELDRLKADTST
jgi:DNA-binding GntR family transcriptional regulator